MNSSRTTVTILISLGSVFELVVRRDAAAAVMTAAHVLVTSVRAELGIHLSSTAILIIFFSSGFVVLLCLCCIVGAVCHQMCDSDPILEKSTSLPLLAEGKEDVT